MYQRNRLHEHPLRQQRVRMKSLVLVVLLAGCAGDLSSSPCTDGEFCANDFHTEAMDFTSSGDISTSNNDAEDDLSNAQDLQAEDILTAIDAAGVPPDLLHVDLPPADLTCGVCAPGQKRQVACGACSIETDTCGMNCQWILGMCLYVGVCAPGATQQGACSACSQQLCNNSCQWGACQLRQGNTCNDGEMQPCQNPGVCSSSWTCVGCHWPGHCCG